MEREHWLREIDSLDPEVDFHRIYQLTATYEFPWDFSQSLALATFRTFAVPSIGGLLHETGEFIDRAQKRFDDTSLLLDAVLEHGFDAGPGREALRRINQMHGRYPISNDDFRYVLSTFVVVPLRWLSAYGWRPLVDAEVRASVNYYRTLGAHMGIRDLPETLQEFTELMDSYERAHFRFTPETRTLADALLALATSQPGNEKLSPRLAQSLARATMDDPLLKAFGYKRTPWPLRRLVLAGLHARMRKVPTMPPRAEAVRARDLPQVVSYPDGYEISELGTFPAATQTTTKT